MSHNLAIIKAFGKYRAGQIISDAAEIAAVLANPKLVHHVNRTFRPLAEIEAAPAEENTEQPSADDVLDPKPPVAEMPPAPLAETIAAPEAHAASEETTPSVL